jgi:hypothetical protein
MLLHFLPYEARLIFAVEAVAKRFEDRDGFLSDDDIVDIAEDWTINLPWTDDELLAAPTMADVRPRPDYQRLLNALDTATTQEA